MFESLNRDLIDLAIKYFRLLKLIIDKNCGAGRKTLCFQAAIPKRDKLNKLN